MLETTTTRKKRVKVLKDNSMNANTPRRDKKTRSDSDKKQRLQNLTLIGEVIEIPSSDSEEQNEDEMGAGLNEIVDLREQVKQLQQDLAKAQSETDAIRLHETRLKEQHAVLQRDYEAVVQAKNEAEIHSSKSISLDKTKFEDTICCEICAGIMWTPHILPECGHTFCLQCLQEWFTTSLTRHMAEHPDYTPTPRHILAWSHNPLHQLTRQQQAVLAQYKQLEPRYTCPTCRKDVKNKPVEDFAFKSLVHIIAAACGESSPKRGRSGHGKNMNLWDSFFDRIC